MPLETFNPTIAPSPGTKHAPKVNLLEAEFGDGYTQAAPNGLNHIRRIVSLRWEGLTYDQYAELDTFFTNKGGFRPFYFLPRGYSSIAKWTCKEWSGSDKSPWTFEAKLEESFTNEV